jgi:PKHD-type hydroxylase
MNNFLFMKQLPPEVVDLANQEFDQLEPYDGKVVTLGQPVVDYKQRHSTLRAPEFGHWFSGIMYQFGILANEHWQFKIDGQEGMQVADYSDGQHFDWHMDVMPFSGPTDRKVSVVCLMTDPQEYLGGAFQIRGMQEQEDVKTVPLEKGTVIAFPSILWHTVTPVLQGVRRSTTLWLTGPCYR